MVEHNGTGPVDSQSVQTLFSAKGTPNDTSKRITISVLHFSRSISETCSENCAKNSRCYFILVRTRESTTESDKRRPALKDCRCSTHSPASLRIEYPEMIVFGEPRLFRLINDLFS